MVFQAPYPSYDPIDKEGYETVQKRWPIILTGVVNQLHLENHDLFVSLGQADGKDSLEGKLAEGKSLIEKVSKLKYEMARDHALESLPQDGGSQVETYNAELERLAAISKNTWFTAPWLFAECYLYRLIWSFLLQTTHWRRYDPFRAQKIDAFQKSGVAIYSWVAQLNTEIATIIHELDHAKKNIEENVDNLRVLFQEMVQMCLWGNSIDLSLLTNLSLSDIEHLQAVGKDAQAAREAFILKDDQETAWDHLKSLKDGRIDFVLDNAGFELFTDLVFADFLVTHTPYVSKVVMHPKLIPWFVSDVTPSDFSQTFDLLLDDAFLASSCPTEAEKKHLRYMTERWKDYVERGIFSLSVPISTPLGEGIGSTADFWTTHLPYWNMKIHAQSLWTDFHLNSSLVIFKGDLKLTGDISWPTLTPFRVAIAGPLAGSFPLLSLRTSKADVVVGVSNEVAAQLNKTDKHWRVNGR
ncbi:DUF89 domain-containing protein [Guyanagaster necrorhizus]|uniref:Sugar phosphate phosphatase n=1 Tax=Guyanagaster necrorhizus TaxID=856835 RepID=A0A9P7VV44_9AGAR|nr:DUF89 domain-containing protein [Guyanagaster necrorhizus MCA 3950]KAG7447265.1 DUF89 domain-containing protein [Guyanagaster necrorhizus MCA 3950]